MDVAGRVERKAGAVKAVVGRTAKVGRVQQLRAIGAKLRDRKVIDPGAVLRLQRIGRHREIGRLRHTRKPDVAARVEHMDEALSNPEPPMYVP